MKSLEENTRETLQDCLVDDFLAKIKQYCKKKTKLDKSDCETQKYMYTKETLKSSEGWAWPACCTCQHMQRSGERADHAK